MVSVVAPARFGRALTFILGAAGGFSVADLLLTEAVQWRHFTVVLAVCGALLALTSGISYQHHRRPNRAGAFIGLAALIAGVALILASVAIGGLLVGGFAAEGSMVAHPRWGNFLVAFGGSALVGCGGCVALGAYLVWLFRYATRDWATDTPG